MGYIKCLKQYMYLFSGQLISLTGSALTNYALGIWVFLNTKSVISYSGILFIANIPAIFITPIAGVFIDKLNKKHLLIFCDASAAAISLILFLLITTKLISLPLIYIIVLMIGFLSNLRWPSYISMMPKVVDKNYLVRANGLDQISQAVPLLFGPALSGLLLSIIGINGIVAIDSATYIVSMILLLFVKYNETLDNAKTNIKRDFITGIKYVRSNSTVLRMILLIGVLNFASGVLFVAITPMMLKITNAFGLGIIISISGSGMIIGSIVLSAIPSINNKTKVMKIASYIFAASLFLFAFNRFLFVYPIIGFVFAFMTAVIGGLNQTVMQSEVAGGFQGRIFAIRRVFIMATNMLGIIMNGILIEKVFTPFVRGKSSSASFLNTIFARNTSDEDIVLFLVSIVSAILIFFIMKKHKSGGDEQEHTTCTPNIVNNSSLMEDKS